MNEYFGVKLDEIFSRTSEVNGCLEWSGPRFSRGKVQTYPCIPWGGKFWTGNRLVLFLISGRDIKGMFALHKCDNMKCLNPDHLYWGTYLDNARDRRERKRHANTRKTHCNYGHSFSGENVRHNKNGSRTCKSCKWYRDRDMAPKLELKYKI